MYRKRLDRRPSLGSPGREPPFSLSRRNHFYNKLFFKSSKQKKFALGNIKALFKKNKSKRKCTSNDNPVCRKRKKKQTFFTNYLSENIYDEPYNLRPSRIYSDLYFKGNKPLFGYIIKLKDICYTSNVSLLKFEIYKASNKFKYMPVFKQNTLCNFPGLLLLDFCTNLRTSNIYVNIKTKVNEGSFKNYFPMIAYNSLNVTEYFPRSCWSFKVSRVCTGPNKIVGKRDKKRDINLDEISPVENEIVPKCFMTIDDIERSLIEKKKEEIKLQADRNVFLLEPLLLENMSLKNRQKFRQRQYEFKKNVRLMIIYCFLCFCLSIIVFFTLYLT